MIEIRVGDAVKLIEDIADGTVDLIFTDPPYAREYLPLYGWLAEQAARVLKAEGFLLVYTGGYHKATVMAMLGRHMEYFWDYVEIHPRASSVVHQRRTVARYKSILAYRKQGTGAMPVIGNVLGAFEMTGCDKRYHRWGQSENTARYLIECFSRPGDLVLDPFVGGGTTPYVCSRIGRRFIGFEIDAEAAAIARARVAGWQPTPQQLSFWNWEEIGRV